MLDETLKLIHWSTKQIKYGLLLENCSTVTSILHPITCTYAHIPYAEQSFSHLSIQAYHLISHQCHVFVSVCTVQQSNLKEFGVQKPLLCRGKSCFKNIFYYFIHERMDTARNIILNDTATYMIQNK